MELLNLVVPKDMCPLDFLAEMKERCKHAWIFMHKSVVSKLTGSEGVDVASGINKCHILTWEATEEYPETKLVISAFESQGWYTVISIKADDIAFKEIDKIEDPECIIRLKMAA